MEPTQTQHECRVIESAGRGRESVIRARWQPELIRRFDAEARRRGQTTSEALRGLAVEFLERCSQQQKV